MTLLLDPGTFTIGANYWASHTGTNMWADWQAEVVDADFQQLASAGLEVLRIFPLWPDFQPIHRLYTGQGQPFEVRFSDRPLPDDAEGRAGMSSEMLDHFQVFADLAQKHGLKLVVGLLTGWMSGRLFVPPALEGLNIHTDPEALMWQVRFVRCFVQRFKDHPAVLAWDLGNECNVMAPTPNHQAAYTWTALITNTIRSEDRSRPVVSGMHSLDEPDENGAWRIQDQAELLDILTTHPYPYWTPHADQDPINTIRTLLHSSAQTRWYGDVGSRPAFCEETGTMGPMVSSEPIAADFLRCILYSLWAHDCRGLLWWCAYDQMHLTHPPYDWHAFERELGLFRIDRSGKPVAAEMQAFRAFLQDLPFERLPGRVVDAVCILTHGQEQWAAVYASFILAKQAGLDLEFQYADQPLKPASLYFVPAVTGGGGFTRRRWLELLERVQAGATLYLSHNEGMVNPFGEVFGLEVEGRGHRAQPALIHLATTSSAQPLVVPAPVRLRLNPINAEVLAREDDGNPVFTRARYGQGWAYFLGVPLELALTNLPGAFDDPAGQPYWQIYALIDRATTNRVVRKLHPLVGVTEHEHGQGRRTVVLINYSPKQVVCGLEIASGWQPANAIRGETPTQGQDGTTCTIPANDAIVFEVSKAA
jgi:hypothetical protein